MRGDVARSSSRDCARPCALLVVRVRRVAPGNRFLSVAAELPGCPASRLGSRSRKRFLILHSGGQMRVVVTGSSGRLGRSVCAGLAASGHHGHRRRSRTAARPRRARRRRARPRPARRVGDRARCSTRLRPDAVVHLAGIAVPFSAPERDILVTNTTLAHTVLAAAARRGRRPRARREQPHGDRLQRARLARGVRADRRGRTPRTRPTPTPSRRSSSRRPCACSRAPPPAPTGSSARAT